jgi:G3E family GTPase
LQHILHNKQGLRIGVIVNDVANVNIDSKLVAGSLAGAGPSGMVELQNGCACCSLSEELIMSVSELVTLSDMRADEDAFDHIVVELSGIADPKGVRSLFQDAVLADMPLMERVRLDTMVTVIDCSIFLNHLKSDKIASPDSTPELYYRDGEEPVTNEDWMEGIPKLLLETLITSGFKDTIQNPANTENSVADLLVTQTEIADIVLLNKMDLSDERTALQIESIVTALNPRATVMRTQFGEVDLDDILATAGGQGVVEAGIVDDHKDAVKAALNEDQSHHATPSDRVYSHSHSNTHTHEVVAVGTDPTHDHSHSSSEAIVCTDLSHDHSDEPDAAVCTDPTHDHSHSPACTEVICTDPTHDHSHAPDHAGIGSCVYQTRRPFHPMRLISFLRNLPVVRGLPVDFDEESIPMPDRTIKILNNVVRSKGFAWCADSNNAALYWSHAGSSFEMQCIGRWWATLPRDQWPAEAITSLLQDFDDPSHDEGSAESTSVGDRRQEIVFIGPGLGDRAKQSCIYDGLDLCLLTDSEWSEYQRKRNDEKLLKMTFVNPIKIRMVSY